MPAEPPPDVARSAVESGAKKAGETWDTRSSARSSPYIAFGGLVAITVSSGTVSSGLDPATWGTLPTLFTGSV